MLDWLIGLLLPRVGAPNWSGIVLVLTGVVILVVHLVLVGRSRRYRLEAERHAMRAEESARIAARGDHR